MHVNNTTCSPFVRQLELERSIFTLPTFLRSAMVSLELFGAIRSFQKSLLGVHFKIGNRRRPSHISRSRSRSGSDRSLERENDVHVSETQLWDLILASVQFREQCENLYYLPPVPFHEM